jgi:hypothetical protein
VSDWTVDTLREHVRVQIADMRLMLQERYETQTKAVDAAFLAQQTAMSTALTAAERAVQTALLAAEKAVTKAEIAANARFDSVNEFRAQLADQASTFVSRGEFSAQHSALADKVEVDSKRLNERLSQMELVLTSRLDVAQEQNRGGVEHRSEQRLNAGQAIAAISLFINVVLAVVVVVTTIR